MKKLLALLLALVMLSVSGTMALAETLNAYLYFHDKDNWPDGTNPWGEAPMTNATIDPSQDDAVTYTVGVDFNPVNFPGGSGIEGPEGGNGRVYMVIEGAQANYSDWFVKITDVRISGASVPFNDNVAGVYDWDHDTTAQHTGVPIYVPWKVGTGWKLFNQTDWSGNGSTEVLTNDQMIGIESIFIDFIFTAKGAAPEETWYPNNTMGVIGYSLRDNGIGSKWYNVVPVDLTKDATYTIPMAASNMVLMGNAIVTIEGGKATVTYQLPFASPGLLTVSDECVKWFDEMGDITEAFVEDPQSDLHFGEAFDVSAMGNVGYLFIRNQVSYRQPITNDGAFLPGYYSNSREWVNHRQMLDEIVKIQETAE